MSAKPFQVLDQKIFIGKCPLWDLVVSTLVFFFDNASSNPTDTRGLFL